MAIFRIKIPALWKEWLCINSESLSLGFAAVLPEPAEAPTHW